MSVAGALAAAGAQPLARLDAAAARAGAAAGLAAAQRRGLRLAARASPPPWRSPRSRRSLFGRGLAAGFAVMGGLLLAAALALPAVLAAVLALGGRPARGPVAQWVWADARQQLGAVAGADGAAAGARGQRRRRHDGRQLPPHLPRLARPAARLRGLCDRPRRRRGRGDGRLARRAARGRGGAADLERRAPASRDWPVEVYGFRDHATYRDNWPLLAALPDAWDRVAARRGRAGLRAARPPLRPRASATRSTLADARRALGGCRSPAIYPDYGNAEGQVMVAVDALAARWPEADRRRMAVRVDARRRRRAARRPARGLRARATAQVVDQRGLKDAVAAHLREDLRRHRGAERADAGRGGDRAPDQPPDAGRRPRWCSSRRSGRMRLTRRRLALIELGKALGARGADRARRAAARARRSPGC